MSFELVDQLLKHGPRKSGDKIVLVAIASFLNSRTGRCDPSMVGIAARASMSEKGARDAVRRLEASGWIRVKEGGGRAGRSEYTINPEATSPFTERKPGSSGAETRKLLPRNPEVTSLNPEVTSPEPRRTRKENQEGEPTAAGAPTQDAISLIDAAAPEPDDFARLFEGIWSNWPKRDGRAEAEHELRQVLLHGVPFEEVARGAAAYIADRRRDARGANAVRQFTTPLGRWLRNGSWATWAKLPEDEARAAQQIDAGAQARAERERTRAALRAAMPF